MTEAVLTAPHEILILSRDRLWRRFELRWRFTPEAAGCRLNCTMDMQFASALLEGLSHVAGSRLETEVMDAFERRAAKLYGRRT
jgi:ribosome-associated toxin RatA of RatAB toxin-antitoxin module